MVIADTDLIIGFLRGNIEAREYIQKLELNQQKIMITSFTVFELYKGAHKSQNKERNLVQINNLFRDVDIIDFDNRSACIAAELDARLEKNGSQIGTVDTFIAAVCIANGETLITRNSRHYFKIKELTVKSW